MTEILLAPASVLQMAMGHLLICAVLLVTNRMLLSRMAHILSTSLKNQAVNQSATRADAATAVTVRVRDVLDMHEKLDAILSRARPPDV